MAGVNSVTLCRPLSYCLHVAPLERGRWNLERGTAACPVPAHDGAVTSYQWSTFPPSPPALCGHAHHCGAIPGTAAPSPHYGSLGR
jgi:hypothetical protein